MGNLIETTDARGNPTSYAYDLNDRLTTVTDAAGRTTHTEHDLDSMVTATVDQAGARTETVYNQQGLPAEVRSPHQAGSTRITRTEYDPVGNPVRVTSPRGSATTEVDDFVQETVYNALNRPVQQILPYDPTNPEHDSPDSIFYEYDPAGRVTTVSTPPSAGQSVRNETVTSYLDTGWVESTTDPWGIVTSYEYNVLGQQTGRTLTSAGGSSGRTMTWDYFPDGKLAARSDDGVPAGLYVVLVDNSDTQNVQFTGTWTRTDTGDGLFGFDYATSAAGTGADSAKWGLHIPQDGSYEVFARWPEVTGVATDATYTITHDGGSTPVVVDQTAQAGEWVSLGEHTFAEGSSEQNVTLTDDANGTVAADAVKLVRDTSGDTDTEAKDLTYSYDVNRNLTDITDQSSNANIDAYTVTYDGLNRIAHAEELLAGAVQNTTSFTYNEIGAPLTRTHDDNHATFAYDNRNLLTTVTNADSPSDPDPKTTSYTYNPRGQKATETKANGNTVTYDYWPDAALREQVETKPDATIVAEHVYEYDLNGNRAVDTSRQMNADNHTDYLQRVSTFTYDPRDRLAAVTRTDPGTGTGTGTQVNSETYTHDANNNVITQTIDGITTNSTYDRNRLQTTEVAGVVSSYNYDPFGRLDTVATAGQTTQRYVYDGFDRIIEQGTDGSTTLKTYDPLDRTATETTDAGSPDEKTILLTYLGLTEQILTEQQGGQITTSYQHDATGRLLSQTKHDGSGAEARPRRSSDMSWLDALG